MIVKRWPTLPAVVWAGLMFVGSSLPSRHIERLQKVNDFSSLAFSGTALHVGSFGLLTALLCFGLSGGMKRRVPYLNTFLAATGYGLLLELWQGLLPTRTLSLKDLVFNTVGVITALSIVAVFKGRPRATAVDG